MKGTSSMLVATLLFPSLAVAQVQVPHIMTDTQNVNVITGASGCVTSCPSHTMSQMRLPELNLLYAQIFVVVIATHTHHHSSEAGTRLIIEQSPSTSPRYSDIH
jgi:hypothetical protein